MPKVKKLNFAPVPVKFAGTPAEDGNRPFAGIAYGGDVITDHPAFERVAFDLESTEVEIPGVVFYAHDHEEPIGRIDAAELDGSIAISGRIFADLDGAAKKVAAMADRGMPWQMSVGIYPGQVDQIKAGRKVSLNGRQIDGPLTVFRNNRVREVSFVALGADGSTSAQIFIGGQPPISGEPTMTTETIEKAEHDRIVAELNAKLEAAQGALTDLQGKFAAKLEQERADSVGALAKELGREFTAEEKAGFAVMDDKTFTFVAGQLRAAKPALDASLTREHATNGEGGETPAGVDAIRQKAREYMAAQAAAGRSISIADAVTFVTRKPA